jgi:Tfp pilus assembly protein PilF
MLAVACLAAVVLIAYAPALRAGFIWDDDEYIQGNVQLRSVEGLKHIWVQVGYVARYALYSRYPQPGVDLDRLWLHATAEPQYYPLTHSTLWLEYHLWGQTPLGYHLDNLLLHLLGSVMLWRLLARLEIPGAFLAALLFAVHPMQSESVAWATERKNVLSGLLYFLSLWTYLNFLNFHPLPEYRARGSKRWLWYLISILLFVMALLSKSVTATLPAAVLLILWWRRGRLGRADLWPLLPMFAAGIAMGSLTGWMEKHVVGAVGPAFDWLTPTDRFCIAGRALWFYLWKLLWPAKLTFIYPHWRIDPRQRPWLLLFPLSVIGGLLGLWLLRRRLGRGPLAAMLFFAVTLLPALGFVNVFPMRYSFVADHFAYLALIGPLTLAAAAMTRYLPRRLGTALLGCIVAGLCVLSNLQSRIYHDPATLWQDTLAKNPEAWMAWENYAIFLLQQRDVPQAQADFRTTLRINPQDSNAMLNLGLIEGGRANFAGAIQWFNDALLHMPDSSEPILRRQRYEPYFNLAVTYKHMADADPDSSRSRADLEQAMRAYRSAIDADPTVAQARSDLGNLLMSLGRRDQALEQFRAIDAARAK